MPPEKTEILYRQLLKRGYPKPFCEEIAYRNMNTDYTAERMLSYLNRTGNPAIEDLVDEMLAILDEREKFAEKKKTEHAQAVINDVYERGL